MLDSNRKYPDNSSSQWLSADCLTVLVKYLQRDIVDDGMYSVELTEQRMVIGLLRNIIRKAKKKV